MASRKHPFLRWLPHVAGLVLFVLVGLLLYWLMTSVGDKETNSKKTIQEITIIQPPPPPPPPPKVEEPPPPEMEEEVIEEPEPAPEDVPDMAEEDIPAGEDLGLDMEGGAGSDAFGLVGKKGGRGLLSGGDPFAWYSSVIQQEIFEHLNENHAIRRSAYKVVVHIWVGPDGSVERVELKRGSGNPRLDKDLRLALAAVDHVSEAPPAEMDQPIALRITARM